MDARLIVLLLIAACALACGCRPPTPAPQPEPPAPQPKTPEALSNAVRYANASFAFKLFDELRSARPAANVFISPLSVTVALAMTANGAAGETRAAMHKTLGFQGPSPEQINESLQALKSELLKADPKVELILADSLWASHEITFKPDFLDLNRKFYDAEVATLDFRKPASADTINQWVEKQTKGLITDMVDADTLADQALVLLDAVYFKGKWTDPFEKNATQDHPFTLLQGKKTVPLMSQSGEYQYLQTEKLQAIRLPYSDGRLEMIVVLPAKASSLDELCAGLTSDTWNAWMATMQRREGTIKLPRFTATYDEQLNDALTALGMGLAFNREAADFSALSETKLWIDLVRQKSYLKVDEEGTEAAAATEVGMVATAAPPQGEPFEMIVDRPFFLAIRDSRTETILFMGAIVDPQTD